MKEALNVQVFNEFKRLMAPSLMTPEQHMICARLGVLVRNHYKVMEFASDMPFCLEEICDLENEEEVCPLCEQEWD